MLQLQVGVAQIRANCNVNWCGPLPVVGCRSHAQPPKASHNSVTPVCSELLGRTTSLGGGEARIRRRPAGESAGARDFFWPWVEMNNKQ